MAITKFNVGETICNSGDALDSLYVIGDGIVRAVFPGGILTLSKGDIIGIQDIRTGIHSCSYVALSNTSLIPYPFNGFEQLLTLFQSNPNIMHLFFSASARFSNALLNYCAENNDFETADGSSTTADSMDQMDAAEDDSIELDMDDEIAAYDSIPEINSNVVLPEDDGEIPQELENALQCILTYGRCDEELLVRFSTEIAQFKSMADKDGTQDSDRAFRNALVSDFYKVYRDVFVASLDNDFMPHAVKLFLNFGFVDAQLAGASNSAYLLSIIDEYRGAPDYGVYTFYEWLLAIYEGEKEPSRNEFDLDYPAYLREQRSSGNITAHDEKRMLESDIDKVYFELENVFPIVNKMTFGRISTFCPVLSAHNLLKPLPQALVTPQKIIQTIDSIKKVDFSAFCRETVYNNDSVGIAREFLQVEVLPDVILMPNAGVRGAMWQEIEGKRRTTPARMMLSIIQLENIFSLMTRMTGEFRWEMCKRIQGAHWNNIAERSLTSEYTDYAQFYKKNHELSPEAKEKIKLNLQKSKNSIKEMFIRDYITWIFHEGNGSPHLNKIARSIIFTYCPFRADIRENLAQHPLYSALIDRHQLQTSQKLHHLDVLCGKIEKSGNKIPAEIVRLREFYNQ